MLERLNLPIRLPLDTRLTREVRERGEDVADTSASFSNSSGAVMYDASLCGEAG